MIRRSALVGDEPQNVLGPLSGLFDDIEDIIVTFREAVDEMELGSREGVIPIPEEHLESAFSNCMLFAQGNSSEKMSIDEIASVHMYSLEFKKDISDCSRSIYSVLNEKLRSEDRNQLLRFRKYMILLLRAIKKCSLVEARVLFRGILFAVDLSVYNVGNFVTWYQFSSCTTDLGVQQKFLGDDGDRTLFQIEVVYGRARMINEFSKYRDEAEAVFPPFSRFEIVGLYRAGNGLATVHLREVAPLDIIIDFSVNTGKVYSSWFW